MELGGARSWGLVGERCGRLREGHQPQLERVDLAAGGLADLVLLAQSKGELDEDLAGLFVMPPSVSIEL